jgi:hypothetical protein
MEVLVLMGVRPFPLACAASWISSYKHGNLLGAVVAMTGLHVWL